MKQEKRVNYYVNLLWWPIILTLIFEVSALFVSNSDSLILLADLFLICYLIIKTKMSDYRLAIWLNGLVVLFLAFIVAIIKFFINFKFYYLFNIIVEPVIYALGAALFSSSFILIFNKFKLRPLTGATKEGGEEHGRR